MQTIFWLAVGLLLISCFVIWYKLSDYSDNDSDWQSFEDSMDEEEDV